MTIEDLKTGDLIILEAISGSKAYGLDTPESDTDIKGVYILPEPEFFGLQYIPQVSNSSNDIVFYELRRFFELLSVNNPNILELLATPEGCILFKNPLIEHIQPTLFLSKLCQDTFGKFALSQIKKAKGLKKKIMNPMDKDRKSVLDLCFINHKQGSTPLVKFLEIKGWHQSDCGLVNLPHMPNIYGLYYGKNLGYQGIIKKEDSNDVALSSIPKNEIQRSILYFNKDGYSYYCREYKEYWEWVETRNEERYKNTMSHGKNYDAKNMMHVFRLLDMAYEIATEGQINVQRPNRDFLLKIKSGAFQYEELLSMADQKTERMKKAFEKSNLPDTPNMERINKLLVDIRKKYYLK